MANVERAYDILPNPEKDFYLFESRGEKGDILKFVWLQKTEENKYNLAFGDILEDGTFSDKAVSDNKDVAEIISTVAKCVYHFLEDRPGVIITIKPVDSKRASLYNYVFRNHLEEIEVRFEVEGFRDGKKEKFDASKFYESFEVTHKIVKA